MGIKDKFLRISASILGLESKLSQKNEPPKEGGFSAESFGASNSKQESDQPDFRRISAPKRFQPLALDDFDPLIVEYWNGRGYIQLREIVLRAKAANPNLTSLDFCRKVIECSGRGN